MLKAEIALSDLSCQVEWQGDVIALGESRIVPHPHPALETLLVRTEGQWFVVVRECLAATGIHEKASTGVIDAERFNELYRACLMWPLDYVMIEVAQEGQRLKIRSGVLGSAPVYCRATDDRVTISWDFADFLDHPLAIDLEIASHYLALSTVYSAQHICAGITMLTERSSLYLEPGKARYHYPTPVEAAAPSTSKPPAGGDTLAAFRALLHNVVSARPATAAQIALELSGGMDSATVASALSTTFGAVASRGILLSGDHRQAQVERRQRIASELGLLDHTVEIDAFPPTLDLRPRQRREYPHPELYLEAFEALWGSARTQGCELLFTGIGGDELFPTYRNEAVQEQRKSDPLVAAARGYAEKILSPRALGAARSLRVLDAPASPVAVSSLLASACQAPHLLRRGLWPVNPLSDPRLVAFCHRLPAEGRHGRETMRQYLHACLGDGVFPRHYVKETFARTLPHLISKQAKTIASQLQDCALADLGLVDQRAVLALLNEVASTQEDAPTAPLVSLLWLERFVRQIG
jgi:asparagine synthase (glutamine-hydrolysing)